MIIEYFKMTMNTFEGDELLQRTGGKFQCATILGGDNH